VLITFLSHFHSFRKEGDEKKDEARPADQGSTEQPKQDEGKKDEAKT
jgi:hypothetical protein